MWAGASSIVVALAVVAACNEPLAPPGAKDKPKDQPPIAARDAAPANAAPADAAPADAASAIESPREIDAAVDAAPPAAPLYTVTDALADAKSSPLKRLGIGAWPGNFSIKGCVYKNDRVFVVDVYCTYKEQTAFSVNVVSPAKGEVRVYAEANDPISKVGRSDYFSFYAETYPPLPQLPAPALQDATFQQIADWEQASYDTRNGLDACSTGVASCALDPAWLDAARKFIAEPNEDWKWCIDQLRNRAQHDGKYVAKKVPK